MLNRLKPHSLTTVVVFSSVVYHVSTLRHSLLLSVVLRAQMLSYLLDFGYVVYGTVRSHVVRVTNNGVLPVSFAPDKSHLSGTGFVVDLDRVRGLPGDPEHESFDFMVTFDPRAANAPLGPLMAHVPIHVLGGPTLGLQMRANVAMPGMAVSTESLDFGTVECGQCKVMTIQLHNQQQVRLVSGINKCTPILVHLNVHGNKPLKIEIC